MSYANPLELLMLGLINDARAAEGLDPLRLITLLNEAAETHSQWMLEADQFSHDGADGSSPSDRMESAGYPFEGNSLALENIGWQSARGAEGSEDDVAQIHESLMNSPDHRANILNPDAEDVGIGIETGPFTGDTSDFDAVMVTQLFGATDADISAWIDPGTGSPDDIIEEDIVEEPEDQIADDNPETTPETEVPETDVVTPIDPIDPVDPQIAEYTPDDDTEDDLVAEEPDVAMMEGVPLPCGLSEFTVDLSEAFQFTRGGDQFIWETSQEQLVETFMTAFESWAETSGDVEQVDADESGEMDITDLMIEGSENALPDAYGCGQAGDDTDEWISQECV